MAEGTTAVGRTRMHDIDLLGATTTTTANQRRGGEPVAMQGSYRAIRRRRRKPSDGNGFAYGAQRARSGMRPIRETEARGKKDNGSCFVSQLTVGRPTRDAGTRPRPAVDRKTVDRRTARFARLHHMKRMLQILQQILHILHAAAQPDQPFRDPELRSSLRFDARVRH